MQNIQKQLKPIILLLLVIIVLSIYATYLKTRERFNVGDPAIYSASVIATTNNSITSPTRLHLHRPNNMHIFTAPSSTQISRVQPPIPVSIPTPYPSNYGSSLSGGFIGISYIAQSKGIDNILSTVQHTIATAQRAGCDVSNADFIKQKNEIITLLREHDNVTCDDLKQLVFSIMEMESSDSVKITSIPSLWDTVASEFCNKATGIVDIDKLEVFMTGLYKSFCP